MWRSWRRSCLPSCPSSEQSTSYLPTVTSSPTRSVLLIYLFPAAVLLWLVFLSHCDLHRLSIHILHYSQLKRGLISTPPSDMLPTAEGGKANAWLRQKNAGIYVRPRLFSPYVEEAKVRFIYLWLRPETSGIFVSNIAIAKVSRVSVKGAG